MAFLFTIYYPLVIAVVFLACLCALDVPGKRSFFWRALVALVIAVCLAHVNRVFDLWPADRFFPSGHTTFCLGVAVSLGMLRPWTLAITLPLTVLLGVSLVALHLHTVSDILGAIPLVLVVYGIVHRCWSVAPAPPPLDRATVSP
jgi:membrane-associated phospholipid phosphatase